MKKTSTNLLSLFLGAGLISLGSCGGDRKTSSRTSLSETRAPEENVVDDIGIFRAVLKPLNSSLSHSTTGTLEIKIDGDRFSVKSSITGAPAGVKHLQNIMVGSNCPDESSDRNGDLLIDIKEAIAASGNFLLPLDSDLSAQLDGVDFGPIANAAGDYVYTRSAALSQVIEDLQIPDPDPLDPIVKLPRSGTGINLRNRVVVVHGVQGLTELPETVSGIDGVPRELLVPIACGPLVKVAAEDDATIDTDGSIVP